MKCMHVFKNMKAGTAFSFEAVCRLPHMLYMPNFLSCPFIIVCCWEGSLNAHFQKHFFFSFSFYFFFYGIPLLETFSSQVMWHLFGWRKYLQANGTQTLRCNSLPEPCALTLTLADMVCIQDIWELSMALKKTKHTPLTHTFFLTFHQTQM